MKLKLDRRVVSAEKLWRCAAFGGALALVALAFACSRHLGLTLDEPLQLRYGNRILAWYQSGFHDRSALTYAAPLYEYGGLFEAPVQFIAWLLPFELIATRHVLTSLTAAAGIAAAWQLATRISGPRAGFIAALLLALTPAWWGHGLFNSKDIPFGAAAAWALYASVNLVLGPRPAPWRSVAFAGLATGAALGVRPGGLFLIAYPALALAARAGLDARRSRLGEAPNECGESESPRALTGAALRVAAFLGLAWCVMLVCWPWAQLHPLSRPFEAIQHASHTPWGGDMLFRGAIVNAQATPREYLPMWFAITLPETYLLAALCAAAWAIHAWRARTTDAPAMGPDPSRDRAVALALIAFAAIGPVVAVVALQTRLYDAQRHFLFVLPPLAAMSGIAISSWFDTQREFAARRALAAAVLATALGLTAHDMFALHPYEYVYFNRFAGGLAEASRRYETDYWGASYEEGLAWVVHHVRPAQGTRLRVASCNGYYETRRYIQDVAHASSQFEAVRDGAAADILLVGAQRHCEPPPGQVLQVVKRDGVPLLEVVKRDRRRS